MRKYLVCLFIIIVIHQPATAQTAHRLTFASEDNAIELAVANTSALRIADVGVRIENAPAWLRFTQTEQTISSIESGAEQPAVFSFSVDKSAPVGTEQTLTFAVIGSNGQSWTKDIRVTVAAPETFELFQNYPNPFNPTTVISYQLPAAGRVNLKIYNLLGQEVMTLVDGERQAGFHRETFDAHAMASGMYIYQLSVPEPGGSYTLARKTMLLLK